MIDFLSFFSVRNSVPLILLIVVLHLVAQHVGADDPTPRWWGRGFACAGFATYAALAINVLAPATPWDFLQLSVQAVFAMGTVHGLALIALPLARFLYRHVWDLYVEHRLVKEQEARRAELEREERERAMQQQIERERWAAEQEQKPEPAAPPPPPLTIEERIAAAKNRYEETLRLLANAHLDEAELKAAQERAKQKYVHELDEVMK